MSDAIVNTGGQVARDVLKKQGLIGLLLLILVVQNFVSEYLRESSNAKLLTTFCERLEGRIDATAKFEARTDVTLDRQSLLLEKLTVGQERQNMLLERLLNRLEEQGIDAPHPPSSS